MSNRTASKPGDFGTCRACNDYLVPGERGRGCQHPHCYLADRCCESCVVECCECGKTFCHKHLMPPGNFGRRMCLTCAEPDVDDNVEGRAKWNGLLAHEAREAGL